MCNLYKMHRSSDEVARIFNAVDASAGSNHGELIYPGYPGLVVADGMVRSMTWGFPLVLKSKKTGAPLKPKPVNNARTDKLDSFMWKFSFLERRCLIPVTGFCEAEGEKGAMTRTWITLPGSEVFACAGIWRDSDEWGPVYSMVMTDPCPSTAEVHDRMPVILAPDDYTRGPMARRRPRRRCACLGRAQIARLTGQRSPGFRSAHDEASAFPSS